MSRRSVLMCMGRYECRHLSRIFSMPVSPPDKADHSDNFPSSWLTF